MWLGIEEVRLRSTVSKPVSQRFQKAASHEVFEDTGFNLGERVSHPKFEEGTILNFEGSGKNAIVQVNFDNFGMKRLVLTYASLTKV